jgi:tetratricopeptide (TPR) repeat protein
MGWFLTFTDRHEEAYAYYDEVLALDPHFQNAIGNLAVLNMATGRYDEARARWRELTTLTKYDPATDLAIVDALENPALTKKAISLIEQDPNMMNGTGGKALNLMLLGEQELALDNLEKAFAEGDSYAIHMKRLGIYAPLRDKPRFQALLAKMNMWP